ncbi:MAG: short-chain dehydrogenase reductase sdr [Lasallia pustulata]|uniref:Short-chain dehydrogenase reductase sdr n=1 Tax=Lasallia pustulata TaxID=136370 RepID=A0A5M8PNV8_9LECA|nr:MAG: short-chain dehydrogenase reductase sdr [Lasallia pustulata]
MANAFTTEAFTELGIGLTLIALRTYARWDSVGFRNFMFDDYLILLAAVVYSLETAAAYSVGHRFHGLANNSMTDEQRMTLEPSSHEYSLRVGGSKLQLIGWSLYTLLLWLLKLCMLGLYTRLTTGLQHMKIRIKIGYLLIGVTYVATITAILAGCGAPFRKNWQIYPDPGNHCQPAISKMDLFFTVVLNVTTDMYLLSIPLPMLWKAQIAPRKKAWLILMFSGGIFVMMAAILRCVLILTAGANGAQQAGSWAVRETFVAVVINNVPMIQPFLTRLAKKVGVSFSTIGSGGDSSHDTPLEDRSKASRKPRTANPLSVSSSAECIIEERWRKDQNRSLDRAVDAKQGINVASDTMVHFESPSTEERSDGYTGRYNCTVTT